MKEILTQTVTTKALDTLERFLCSLKASPRGLQATFVTNSTNAIGLWSGAVFKMSKPIRMRVKSPLRSEDEFLYTRYVKVTYANFYGKSSIIVYPCSSKGQVVSLTPAVRVDGSTSIPEGLRALGVTQIKNFDDGLA